MAAIACLPYSFKVRRTVQQIVLSAACSHMNTISDQLSDMSKDMDSYIRNSTDKSKFAADGTSYCHLLYVVQIVNRLNLHNPEPHVDTALIRLSLK